MKRRLLILCAAVGLLLLAIALPFSNVLQAGPPVNVTMERYNLSRNSVNLQETTLNTTNVAPDKFGLLFTLPVTGEVYAQPLIVTGVTIPNKGTHNVLYIATAHNLVYAFDADKAGPALWTVNLGAPFTANLEAADMTGLEDGVLSTPQIDLATKTMYIVSHHDADPTCSGSPNGAYHKLHALDITTGTEKFNGPKCIVGSVDGNGVGNDGAGHIPYDAFYQLQRPAITLYNGKILIAMGSTGDNGPFHGWLFAYTANNLQSAPAVWNTTPNGDGGGLWAAGTGVTIDDAGNMYVMTGNGSFNADTCTPNPCNYSTSFVKLKLDTATNQFQVLDYFAPWDQAYLGGPADLDLGSSGPTLIPGTHLLFGGGKTSTLYVVDGDNMGHFIPDTDGNNHDDQIVQEWEGKVGHLHNSPNIWRGPDATYGYVFAENDYLKQFEFHNNQFNTIPIYTASYKNNGMPSAVMSVSSNGSQPGTGILWSTDYFSNFRAVDATNISKTLWTDTMNPLDRLGDATSGLVPSRQQAKFVPPIVANGKVYLGTRLNKVRVYGLLTPGSGGSLSATLAHPPAVNVNLTTEGTADWVHWGRSSNTDVNRKDIPTPLISNIITEGYGPTQYTDNYTHFSWSDGTPTVNETDAHSGIYTGPDEDPGRFTLFVPADTTPRILKVYVGLSQARGKIYAALSDRSAPAFTDSFQNLNPPPNGNDYGEYIISYKAASAGQTLVVQWTLDYGPGNVTFQAAALSNGGPLPTSTPTLGVPTDFVPQPTFQPPTNTPSGAPTATPTHPPTPGPSPTTPPPNAFRLQYEAINTLATETKIDAGFNIVNLTNSAANLTDFEIRYYFTKDGGGSLQFQCTYAVVNCSNVNGAFVPVTPAVTGADTYLSLTFDSGTIPPSFGSSGRILFNITKSDNSSFNQSDDFSFDASKMTFTETKLAPLFKNGTLVWGGVPGIIATTLQAPVDGATSQPTQPTFQWAKVANAARYQLRVYSSENSPVIERWYDASAVCTASCSVTSPAVLANGPYTWWVQTWSSAGDGPWSASRTFSVGP